MWLYGIGLIAAFAAIAIIVDSIRMRITQRQADIVDLAMLRSQPLKERVLGKYTPRWVRVVAGLSFVLLLVPGISLVAWDGTRAVLRSDSVLVKLSLAYAGIGLVLGIRSVMSGKKGGLACPRPYWVMRLFGRFSLRSRFASAVDRGDMRRASPTQLPYDLVRRGRPLRLGDQWQRLIRAVIMESRFPPVLAIGSRVWSMSGYREHGPIEGPKIDIPPNLGGTIESTSKPNFTMDQHLYTVRWDNGQLSKHYETGLLCIGRFQSLSEFKQAISVEGPVELVLGPQRGFRAVKIRLEYDGELQEVELDQSDRRLWGDILEPMVAEAGLGIEETILPPRPRARRNPYDPIEPNTLRVKLTASLKKKLEALAERTGESADKLTRHWIEEALKRRY